MDKTVAHLLVDTLVAAGVIETGTGTFNILNNGQVLTATNTGNGVITRRFNL
jgi:hypothetical protein